MLLLSIFAATSILLLSTSGVLHMLEEGSTGRNVLGRLDKAAIFALIAGTPGFYLRRGFYRTKCRSY